MTDRIGNSVAIASEPSALGEIEPFAAGWRFALLGNAGETLAQFFYTTQDDAAKSHAALRRGLSCVPSPAKENELDPPAQYAPLEYSERYTVRQWIYSVLEEGQLNTFWSRLIEYILVGIILANVIAVALETEPSIYARYHSFFFSFERSSVVIYTIEYFLRLWSSIEDPRIAALGPVRGRIAFALRPMMVVDFLAFAPSYLGFFVSLDLRVLRIFRMFRLVKLARYSQAMQALLGVLYSERAALFASVILLLSTVCVSGELMHIVEGNVQPTKLGTLPEAMYWAITTLTTVGYGDVTPLTPLGRLIAGVTMVVGLALFALPIGIIANGFVTGLHRRRFAVTWSMLKRQSLFTGFPIEALHDIMESTTATIVREHAHVTVAEEEAKAFYLIVSGIAIAEDGSGDSEVGPGEFMGEEALQLSGRFKKTTTAMTDMHLLMFPGEELRRLVRKYPDLANRIRRNVSGAISAAEPAIEQRLQAMERENSRLRQALSDLALRKWSEQSEDAPQSSG